MVRDQATSEEAVSRIANAINFVTWGIRPAVGAANPHRNKYRIISTTHLSDTYYTGSSGKAWYLSANPNVLPAFEIVFLNGRRTPVIERVEMPTNMLGMGFRSYIDFGVTIGDRNVIGAGSVVTKDAPAGVVVAGNPARIIREIA